MKKYIVYQTTNKINKKIYIGVHKTKDPNKFDGYIGGGIYVNNPSSYKKPNSPYQAAVKKYGPNNFVRTVLSVFDLAIDAFALEGKLVNKDFIKRKDTYNAQLGGLITGFRLNPTFQFNEEGELLKEWDNMAEASEFYNISHTAIMNAIKYKESSFGYYWSHEKSININEYSKINKGTVCYVYDSDSLKYLYRFESIPKAAKELGISRQEIQRAIKGGFLCKNYYFSTSIMEIFEVPKRISIRNKKIYLYDLEGNFIKEFENTNDIKIYLNIKTTNPITESLRKKKPYKQWQFSLDKVEKMTKCINQRNIPKKIGRYSLKEENLLEIFDSITQAINIYGTGVQRVLKGQQSHCKGYMFKYIED